MPDAKNTYIVEPTTGGEPYEVTGTKYEIKAGQHLIYDGTDLVAAILNASVRKKA